MLCMLTLSSEEDGDFIICWAMMEEVSSFTYTGKRAETYSLKIFTH